jgi:hypothetical protein
MINPAIHRKDLREMLAVDLWQDHPDWPRSEWRLEAGNDDTLLGYWEWVQAKLEELDQEAEFRCPACSHVGSLFICACVWVLADKNGADSSADELKNGPGYDIEWDNDSGAQCPKCHGGGRVEDFQHG